MKVKFNKDLLLKQRFWILAGLTGVLTLVGLSYLVVYGSDEADAARKKLVVLQKRPAKPESNRAKIEEIAKKAEDAQKSANLVWSQAYNEQAKEFTWPDKIEKRFNFLDGYFANEIKISPATAPKEWPADTDFLMHGILEGSQTELIKVRKRKSDKEEHEIEVFRMAAPKITELDKPEQALTWADLVAHKGKLVAISYQKGKYFGDLLTPAESRLFAESYRDQLDGILQQVRPVNEQGVGVVQLRDWLYRPGALPVGDKNTRKFFRYVTQEWNVGNIEPVKFSAEAWIAQENLWIQREIYRLIRAANDDISKFKRILEPEADKAKSKVVDKLLFDGEKKNHAYSFQNVNFEAQLSLQDDGTLKFKIRNLLPRKQKLDLYFRVSLNKARPPAEFRISGQPLMPTGQKGDDHVQDEKPDKDLIRLGIYEVEQILTWETAAIKRIDNISIGSVETDIAMSHREFAKPLRGLEAAEPAKQEDKKDDMKKGDFGGGDKAAAVNKTVLPHDLWTDRYEDVTEQSRRLPVAVALIVDQDHVNRVLTHFNNSKFRFLHSQVPLNHYATSIAPGGVIEQKKEGGGPGVGEGSKGFKGFPPMGVGPGDGGTQASGGAGHDTNMEIIIYGVMTLYQRFPPRPMPAKTQQ